MSSGAPTRFARSLLFVLLLLLVSGHFPAHAVSLSIDSTGTSDYSIFAIQLDDITSLQIQIAYDVSTLKNPKFSPTGMLLSRATVQTGIASKGGIAFTVQATGSLIGSGMIATLDFDLEHEEWPGKIISAMATVTEENGKSYVVPITVNNPPQQRLKPEKEEAEQEQEQEAEQEQSAPSPTASPARVVPSVATPESSAPRNRGAPPEPDASEAWSGEAVRGVLERFSELPENNLHGGLRQLIAAGMGEEFVQDPPVALSDGATRLMVRFRPARQVRKTPFFILRGATCVSLGYREDAWELRILPHAGVRDAVVTVAYETASRDYPLTLAPPLEMYLAGRKKETPPNRYDSYVELVNELAGHRGAAGASSFPVPARSSRRGESGSPPGVAKRISAGHRSTKACARSR